MTTKDYLDYKRESRKRKDETYEERKKEAFKTGTRIEYLTCPLCGRNKVMNDRWGRSAKFEVKPDYAIVQIRYGLGGRKAGGFFLKLDECIMFDDLKDDYPAIWKNLKAEVTKLDKLIKEKEALA